MISDKIENIDTVEQNKVYRLESLLKALDACGSIFQSFLILSELKNLLDSDISLFRKFKQDILPELRKLSINLSPNKENAYINYADLYTLNKVRSLCQQITFTNFDKSETLTDEDILEALKYPEINPLELSTIIKNLLGNFKIDLIKFAGCMDDPSCSNIVENYIILKLQTNPQWNESELVILIEPIIEHKGILYSINFVKFILEKYRNNTIYSDLYALRERLETSIQNENSTKKIA